MTSTNEYSIHIYFIYKLIITRIAQLNDIESVIIYLRVLSGHRFDVDIERTIGNGFSRNRRLHSLSLSLSTTIVHAHFGIPFVVSRIYIHVHNNRTGAMVQWNDRPNNRSRGVESIAKKYPRKRISPSRPRIGANRVETGTTGLAYLRSPVSWLYLA